ncbi:TPA: LuxR C-terminal-related transcriptional regulator [Salmonella enterica subsp. enterica serovar Chester]
MSTEKRLQDEDPKQHLIFLVNGCAYFRMGLDLLMKEAGYRIRIVPINQPEDILACPVGQYESRLLIVSLPSEPVRAARGQVFLWRLEVLRSRGMSVGSLLCLLDGERERWASSLLGYRWLPLDEGVGVMQTIIFSVLNSPKGDASLPVVRNCRLSWRQQYILDATLAGLSVRLISEALNISESAVFSARTALMKKMGLNNRLELMSLAGSGFIKEGLGIDNVEQTYT